MIKIYDFIALLAMGLMFGLIHSWSDTSMIMTIFMVFIYMLYIGLMKELKERK